MPLELNSLEGNRKVLQKLQIVGHHPYLGKNKLNFPHVSDQGMQAKIDKLIKTYDDECVRKGKYAQNERFDITLWLESLWFSLRDKRLYHLQ